MSDMAHFSDDISDLWGPGNESVVEPGPPTQVRAERPSETEAPPPAPDRLADLEARVGGLADALEAHRAALDGAMAEQMARLLAETSTATEARIAVLEGQLARRLQEMGEQVTAMIATATAGGPQDLQAIGPESSRVDALERQLHEGVTSVHRAVNAMRAGAVGSAELEAIEERTKNDLARLTGWIEAQFLQRAEMKTLWDAMKVSLDASLAQVRTDVMAAAAADVAAVRADMASRLAVLEEQVMRLGSATAKSAD